MTRKVSLSIWRSSAGARSQSGQTQPGEKDGPGYKRYPVGRVDIDVQAPELPVDDDTHQRRIEAPDRGEGIGFDELDDSQHDDVEHAIGPHHAVRRQDQSAAGCDDIQAGYPIISGY